MIPFKSKLNVSFGINWLLILSLLLASNVNCQRDGRDFTFQSSSSSSSSSSSGETFGSRDRAAYIDGNADRYNSNSPTRAQPSSSLISSSPSIVASAQFDDGESSSIHLRSVISPNYHEAKLLDERDELPERKERPAKNERVSGLDVISASRNDEDDDNGKNRKNVRSLESSSTSEPEKPTRSSGPKKSRTTRPPSPPSTSTTPSPSSTPLTTRTPAVLSNGHRVINSHPSSSSSSTSPSSSSSSRNNNEQSSSLSSSSESTESRPGLINGNFASSNVPKSTKQVNSYLSTLTRCGENITLSSLTTTIVSPGWAEGEKYPPNVECVWVITALRSHFIHKEAAIRVRVKHLEIEQDEVDCRYDYLEIRGYKKLCGFMQNKEILINASSLVIVFRTDSNNEDRGFELELYSHMEDCTPELKATSNSGEITSPGFPKNYPDSTDCWTLINANTLINSGSRSGGIGVGGPENLTISVTFDFIELEPDDQCNYDFVEFFEVDSITKRPTMSLGKFCDEKSIRKTERTIEYNPDPRVSSSHHQPSQPSTHLLITRPTNTNNHQSESLSSSSVSLSPSPVASSSSSSKSSKSPPSPLVNENIKSRATINAKGPYLLVHFKSDHLLNLRGFKAAYKVETDLSRSSLSNCDWAPDESSMTLTSPQHPKPYPPNKDCSLILKAPRSDQKIVLLFDSFLMEIDNNCTFDRLEIYDDFAFLQSDSNDKNKAQTGGGGVRDLTMSKVPTKVFCGHKSSKFKYLSGGPSIRLRFISDSLHEHQGFVARYKFIQGETVEVQPSKPVEAFIEVPQNASIISGSSHLLSCIPSDVQSPTSTQSPAMIDKNIYTNNYHHEGDINFNQNHKNSNKNANSKNILWFKDNQLITDGVSENGTKLLIREFSKLDVGRYTCKYGSATAEAWLKEKNTDCSVIFRKRPRDAILSEGEFTIFECNAISPSQLASKVTITWTKNGKKLVNNSRVDKLKNGYLVINGVTSEDSGHYFCVVRLEDDPGCTSQAGARLDVNPRANVEDICGQPNLALPSKEKPLLDDAGKIVGGADARKGAFPWQVMFWDVNRKSFCGGALLNERWIATAAHCFSQNKYNPPPPPLDTIVVRLGKFDQKETEDQELNTKIQDIIKHPDYNPETFDNDLALVRVRDHIAFTDYIKPVCIGFSRSLIDGLFFTDNHRSIKMGHVTGWGQLKENGPQPRFLQELRMPIVDQDSCRKATTFAVTPNMFCAGYAQEIIGDACKGDSGGPFVGLSSNRWYLIGIVSWGEGCGRTGKYGYYTKVSNYIDWVKGLIKH